MLENTPTLGSVNTTLSEKEAFARKSLHYNVSSSKFRSLFPSYVSKYRELNNLSSDAAVPVPSGTSRDAATMLVGGNVVEAVERGVRRSKDVIAATGVTLLVLVMSLWMNFR